MEEKQGVTNYKVQLDKERFCNQIKELVNNLPDNYDVGKLRNMIRKIAADCIYVEPDDLLSTLVKEYIKEYIRDGIHKSMVPEFETIGGIINKLVDDLQEMIDSMFEE